MSKHDKYTAPRERTNRNNANDTAVPTANDQIKKVTTLYENNKSIISKVLLGVVLVIGAFMTWKYFFLAPKNKKANDAIFRTQLYFKMDSLDWVLNGDGNNKGALKIIKEFSGTAAANLAHYYAGIAYLKKGKFKEAESKLRDFDAKGTLLDANKYGALGDACLEQNKIDNAIEYYTKASNDDKNDLMSPLYLERAAIACEMKGKTEEAIKNYQRLKADFPQSMQAQNVDRKLARLGITD